MLSADRAIASRHNKSVRLPACLTVLYARLERRVGNWIYGHAGLFPGTKWVKLRGSSSSGVFMQAAVFICEFQKPSKKADSAT